MLWRTVACFFCLFAGTALLAQTDRAVLRGVVKDSSGALVPNAQITVTEIQTNVQARTLSSDANGNFEVPDLQPTLYRLKADAAGFRSLCLFTNKLKHVPQCATCRAPPTSDQPTPAYLFSID